MQGDASVIQHLNAVPRNLFSEILKGEEEHVDFLETQLELIGKIGRENYIQLQAEPSR